MKFLPALPLLVSVLSGCISLREGLDDDALSKSGFRIGRTTRRDVVAAWGNPSGISKDEWTWTGKQTTGGQFRLSYYLIGFTLSNEASATRSHHLTFDANGVLTKMRTSNSLPQGPVYSLYPW